jgi:two-component system, NarL family, sensor histidine kinase UhpB
LRPIETIGLQVAIERLVAFWHGRQPDIDFDVVIAIEEDRIVSETREAIYRVVQESLSNAIRHGAPSQVAIQLDEAAGDSVRVEVTDDGIGMVAGPAPGSARLGLIGMRERVMAMAGELSITPGREGKGISVVVRLPCEVSFEAHEDVSE